jgi:hypothetical protein
MTETMKKPTSNRSAKERRNTLFRVLDGILSLSHRKIHAGETVTRQSKAKRGFLILNILIFGSEVTVGLFLEGFGAGTSINCKKQVQANS